MMLRRDFLQGLTFLPFIGRPGRSAPPAGLAVRVADYVTPNGHDDSAALLALFATLPPGCVVDFEPGAVYHLDIGAARLSVPNGATIRGNGATLMLINDPQNGNSNICALYIPDGSAHIEICGLRFVGQNTPFTEHNQLESAAIYLPGITGVTKYVSIHHCDFRNLHGFTIHGAGAGGPVSITDNRMRECANGLNVNFSGVQARNVLERVEGIECGAVGHVVIAENHLVDCGSDINGAVYPLSVGGMTAADDRGSYVVANNVIDGARGGGAMSISTGARGFTVSGNIITRPRNIGIALVQSGDNPISHGALSGNSISDIQMQNTALGIYAAGVTDLTLDGNQVFGEASIADVYMLDCRRVSIGSGNRFTAGGWANIGLSACQDVTVYDPVLGAASVPLRIEGSAATTTAVTKTEVA